MTPDLKNNNRRIDGKIDEKDIRGAFHLIKFSIYSLIFIHPK